MNWQDYSNIKLMELPGRNDGGKACVSGAWYLGIVKGGSCVPAGEEVIGCFTSGTEDFYKLQNGIGLPVLKEFYKNIGADNHPVHPIPYAKEFARIPDVLSQKSSGDDRLSELRSSACPFYRTTINNYRRISPELWRLMIESARFADLATRRKKEWRKDNCHELDKCIKLYVDKFLERCRHINKKS